MTLGALSSGYFVDQGESQALSVLSPAIRETFNSSYGELGQITGWKSILQSLNTPVWDYAADRFSSKWIIVFGTGIRGQWPLAARANWAAETR